MKKIFLFLVASLLTVTLSNCSSDETTNPAPTETTTGVTVKVNGVKKNFPNIEIIQEPWSENGVSYIDLHVFSKNPDDPTEYIYFGVGKGDTGIGQIWSLSYFKDNTQYSIPDTEVSSEMLINVDKRIKGTFSVAASSKGIYPALTEGNFDISY